jgi:hypothetical protein
VPPSAMALVAEAILDLGCARRLDNDQAGTRKRLSAEPENPHRQGPGCLRRPAQWEAPGQFRPLLSVHRFGLD